METTKITVWDYHGARNGAAPWHYQKGTDAFKFEVDAYCVGGKAGVRAFWKEGDIMYEAHGDDGYWYLVGVISVYWVPGMIESMTEVL